MAAPAACRCPVPDASISTVAILDQAVKVAYGRQRGTWKGKCRHDGLRLPQLFPDGASHLLCARVVHPPGRDGALSSLVAAPHTAGTKGGGLHGSIHELNASLLASAYDLLRSLNCLSSAKEFVTVSGTAHVMPAMHAAKKKGTHKKTVVCRRSPPSQKAAKSTHTRNERPKHQSASRILVLPSLATPLAEPGCI